MTRTREENAADLAYQEAQAGLASEQEDRIRAGTPAPGMKLYRVGIQECHVRYVEVEARDEAHAKERAGDGGGVGIGELEFSHAMDSACWSVKEV